VILELWLPTLAAAHLFSGFWLVRAFLVLYPNLHPRRLLGWGVCDEDGDVWRSPQSHLGRGGRKRPVSPSKQKLLAGGEASPGSKNLSGEARWLYKTVNAPEGGVGRGVDAGAGTRAHFGGVGVIPLQRLARPAGNAHHPGRSPWTSRH
jgi:hypothetical protein